jgi:hypothetical protein
VNGEEEVVRNKYAEGFTATNTLLKKIKAG